MGFRKEVRKNLNDLDRRVRITAEELDTMDNDIHGSFGNVGQDVDNLQKRISIRSDEHRELKQRFDRLENELATNGVIRDIRLLQKKVAQLEKDNEHYHVALRNFQQELQTNGVATAINKLNKEIFSNKKSKDTGWNFLWDKRIEGMQEATLAGKVDAIVKYLNLDVEVRPEESKPAEVVAKKVTKKKGRK